MARTVQPTVWQRQSINVICYIKSEVQESCRRGNIASTETLEMESKKAVLHVSIIGGRCGNQRLRTFYFAKKSVRGFLREKRFEH